MASAKWFRRELLGLLLLGAAVAPADAVRDLFQPKKTNVVEIKGEPDPGNLQAHRNDIGKSFYFEVTGANTGTVWGTGVYTDDSHLATAAVHAGVLQTGQKGVIKVTMLPGEASYAGTTQNGVTTHPFQNWQASYRIEPAGPKAKLIVTKGGPLADPGNLSSYQGKVGKAFLFKVTGKNTGTVWGTGIYTDDSDLGTAAVHAGVLRKGQTGIVKVTMLAGQANYPASTANGIASANWANWNGSYRVEAVKKK